MKTIIAVCLFACAAVVLARPQSQYTDKYDNVNIDEIISNKRLLVPYLKCVLDQGRCAPDGKELKSHIADALQTKCAKCTDAQRDGTRKVIGHLINHENDYWNQLTAKYDPQRRYVKEYETELRTVA